MSELADELRKSMRIHGGLTPEAVADAIEAAIPAPTWAATVKPGDTLVLGFDRTISHEQFETIADKIREALPAEVKFLVVSGVTSMAVQRSEGE